jgi:hypothetical protein
MSQNCTTVFALHHHGLWREFVIIARDRLRSLREINEMGNLAGNQLLLYLSLESQDVVCSGTSLQEYRGNWSNWPAIQH